VTKKAYLYGEDIEVPEIPADVVMRRIELLKEHLAELLEHSYHTRDGVRCNAIIKAIKFWENLDKEY
jgi:hypothetical protein